MSRSVPQVGRPLMVVAVVLLAFNLRPAVNALGVAIPELQADTGLSDTVAGMLLALPTLSFAVAGLAVAALAARIGSHMSVLLALVAITVGQLVRAAVPGTAALFAGSVLALAGIAIGNVLLPGLIHQHFPGSIGPMTAVYTTVLMIGQTAGAGMTLPLQHGLGGDWRLGIGLWAAPALLAVLPWLVTAWQELRGPTRRRGADPSAAVPAPTSGASVAIPIRWLVRSPRAWAMAVFFGMQSLQAYVVFGWVPSVLTDAGMSGGKAAGMLTIITAVGIPISALVPSLLGHIRRQESLVIAFSASLIIGYASMLLVPLTLPWLQALLVGFGLGSFPMALTLFALRAHTPQGTTALSAFGQSVGYLLASAGPVGFGLLRQASGASTLPLLAMMVTVLIMAAGGLVAVRDWRIEDDLPSAEAAAAVRTHIPDRPQE